MAGSSSLLLMGVGKVAAAGGGFVPSDVAGLQFWNEKRDLSLSDGDPITTFTGHGGKQNLTQATGAAKPTYHIPGGKAEGDYDGVDDLMTGGTAVPVKHVFVVAKYDGATFGGYHGLLTGKDTTENPGVVLVGNSGTDDFYNDNGGGLSQAPVYHKDGVSHPATAMEGPMNAFAVISISYAGALGWGTITPQIGADRDVGGRFWNGPIRAVLGYDSVLSTTDRQSVETYLAGLL